MVFDNGTPSLPALPKTIPFSAISISPLTVIPPFAKQSSATGMNFNSPLAGLTPIASSICF